MTKPNPNAIRPGGPIGATLLKSMEVLDSLGEGDMNDIYAHLRDVVSAPAAIGKALRRAADEYGCAHRVGGWPARFRPVHDWRERLQARMARRPRIGRVNSVWQLGTNA